MATMNDLSSRLHNSLAYRRGGDGWLPLYRLWKEWALRQPEGPAYFNEVRALGAAVEAGTYDVRHRWPSAGRRRRA